MIGELTRNIRDFYNNTPAVLLDFSGAIQRPFELINQLSDSEKKTYLLGAFLVGAVVVFGGEYLSLDRIIEQLPEDSIVRKGYTCVIGKFNNVENVLQSKIRGYLKI
ncbi:MAG: hypothetical protein KR126chlam6_00960 [Candidatus Anoxychlamydiales bacterium]|nr:hypothetical protein [Candidatus Anoxychlamydiales bacterium]